MFESVFASDRLQRLLKPESLGFLLVTTLLVTLLAVLIRLRFTYATDLSVTRMLQTFERPWATRLARAATWTGNSLTIVLLCAGVMGIALAAGEGAVAVLAPCSLLALPINAIVKNLVDRQRPGEAEAKLHGGPRWGFSYPSGHSMGSAAFYGFLAFLLWLLIPAPPLRIGLTALFALLPLLVGVSRVYLGAHWASDVVGGWAGGLFVAVPLALIYPT